MAQGKLIVISGFSGVGKGTAIAQLMQKNPDRYAFSVSATSRKPRPGEINGEAYYFISREEFRNMISEGKLLEYNVYGDNYYGTPAEPIDRLLADGKNVILDIDFHGMHQITAKRSDVCTIFMIPPSAEVLYRRISGRGTETFGEIRERLATAVTEGNYAKEYSSILTNDNLSDTVDALEACIEAGGQDTAERENALKLTERICKELKEYIED